MISLKNPETYLKIRTENAYFYGFLRVFYGFLRVGNLRDWFLRDHEVIYGIKQVDLRGLGYIYGIHIATLSKMTKNVKTTWKTIKK